MGTGRRIKSQLQSHMTRCPGGQYRPARGCGSSKGPQWSPRPAWWVDRGLTAHARGLRGDLRYWNHMWFQRFFAGIRDSKNIFIANFSSLNQRPRHAICTSLGLPSAGQLGEVYCSSVQRATCTVCLGTEMSRGHPGSWWRHFVTGIPADIYYTRAEYTQHSNRRPVAR
jgi:hypothetical protein